MSTALELTVIGYPVKEDQQPKMLPATDSSSSSSSSTSLQPPGAAHQIPSLIPIQLTKENYSLWKSLFVSVLKASGDMLDIAEASSSSTSLQPPSLIPIQLTKENYSLWKSLFVSVLKASGDMLDIAEGREQCPPPFLTEDKERENPAHTDWIKRDQTLLTWINSTLSLSLLGHTSEFSSGRALWLHLEKLFAENAMTRVRDLKFQLRNLVLKNFPGRKEYLEKAKEIAEALEAAGSPLHDSEFVYFVLNGLPDSYDDEFVASIRDRPEPLSREQLQKKLERYSTKSENIGTKSLMEMFNGGELEHTIMGKSGCLNYATTAWEPIKPDVFERRLSYRFNRNVSIFGGEVACRQRKTPIAKGEGWIIDEVMALQGVPFCDHFRVQLRYRIEKSSPAQNASNCNVYVRSPGSKAQCSWKGSSTT